MEETGGEILDAEGLKLVIGRSLNDRHRRKRIATKEIDDVVTVHGDTQLEHTLMGGNVCVIEDDDEMREVLSWVGAVWRG